MLIVHLCLMFTHEGVKKVHNTYFINALNTMSLTLVCTSYEPWDPLQTFILYFIVVVV